MADRIQDEPKGGETKAGVAVALALFGAAGLAAVELIAVGLRRIVHTDLWWAMAAGRHITRNGEIPTEDIFSYTFAGRPWINLEWLSQVVFYNVYHHLGENAILLLRIGMVFLIFGLALLLAWWRTRNLILSLLVVALGAWVCNRFLDARPQLFTFLNSILYLIVLHRFRRGGRRWVLVFLPLVMLLWVNQHYGFIFGQLLLIGNLLAETLKHGLNRLLGRLGLPPAAAAVSFRDIGWLGAATLASALAILANPWGFEAYTHPLEMSELISGQGPFLTILEWAPPEWNGPFSPFQFWLFLALGGGAIVATLLARARDFDLNDVGLSAVLALFFALQHRRFIPLFVILSIPLVAFSLQVLLDRWRGQREGGRPALAWTGAGAVLLGFVAVLFVRGEKAHRQYVVQTTQPSLFRTNIEFETLPDRSVELIRELGLNGPMYNLYNWGGFLMYFLPEEKVFCDGRAQTLYDEEFYRTNQVVHQGQAGWDRVLDRYGVRFALISMTSTNQHLRSLLTASSGWRWIFAEPYAALFLRVCPENQDLLARYERRELPLPETGMTYLLYGQHAARAQDLEQAVRDFRKAVDLEPDRPEFHGALVRALLGMERFDEARDAVKRGVSRCPDSRELAVERARVEAVAGNEREAFALARRIFEEAPDELDAVEILLLCDPEQAVELVHAAHEKDDDDPRIWLAMGCLYEALGDPRQAEEFYLRTVERTDGRDRDLARKAGQLVLRLRERARRPR